MASDRILRKIDSEATDKNDNTRYMCLVGPSHVSHIFRILILVSLGDISINILKSYYPEDISINILIS